MSTTTPLAAVVPTTHAPRDLPVDDRRGSMGMSLFILTEAMLFVAFFFAYFYLGHLMPHWPPVPPKLAKAFMMLAILVSSSLVLAWGEKGLKRGDAGRARVATAVTIAMGLGFLLVQYWEYMDRLKELSPRSSAYGSLFYTITSFHGAHVVLGLLMLGYTLVLPGPGGETYRGRPPYRPLHNASKYWHFVDVVWVFIVALLYVLPRFMR